MVSFSQFSRNRFLLFVTMQCIATDPDGDDQWGGGNSGNGRQWQEEQFCEGGLEEGGGEWGVEAGIELG